MRGFAPHPWLNPLHRRVLVLAVCLLWLGVETYFGGGFWQLLAVLVTAYAVWDFFLRGAYPIDPGREA